MAGDNNANHETDDGDGLATTTMTKPQQVEKGVLDMTQFGLYLAIELLGPVHVMEYLELVQQFHPYGGGDDGAMKLSSSTPLASAAATNDHSNRNDPVVHIPPLYWRSGLFDYNPSTTTNDGGGSSSSSSDHINERSGWLLWLWQELMKYDISSTSNPQQHSSESVNQHRHLLYFDVTFDFVKTNSKQANKKNDLVEEVDGDIEISIGCFFLCFNGNENTTANDMGISHGEYWKCGHLTSSHLKDHLQSMQFDIHSVTMDTFASMIGIEFRRQHNEQQQRQQHSNILQGGQASSSSSSIISKKRSRNKKAIRRPAIEVQLVPSCETTTSINRVDDDQVGMTNIAMKIPYEEAGNGSLSMMCVSKIVYSNAQLKRMYMDLMQIHHLGRFVIDSTTSKSSSSSPTTIGRSSPSPAKSLQLNGSSSSSSSRSSYVKSQSSSTPSPTSNGGGGGAVAVGAKRKLEMTNNGQTKKKHNNGNASLTHEDKNDLTLQIVQAFYEWKNRQPPSSQEPPSKSASTTTNDTPGMDTNDMNETVASNTTDAGTNSVAEGSMDPVRTSHSTTTSATTSNTVTTLPRGGSDTAALAAATTATTTTATTASSTVTETTGRSATTTTTQVTMGRHGTGGNLHKPIIFPVKKKPRHRPRAR